MRAWKKLAESALMNEERQYRGDTFVSFKDLTSLLVGNPEKGDGVTGSPPDPNGGVATGNYKFDASVLNLGDSKSASGGWHDDLDTAIALATSASTKEIGAGQGTGGMMVKGNYGGRVGMQRAPVQPHHNDRLGSTMDRYDVVIVADFDRVMNKRGMLVPVSIIKKVVYSPSIGSEQERSQRLEDLLAGRETSLPRRPQPSRPGISKDDEERMRRQMARAAAMHGSSSDDDQTKVSKGGSASNHAFRDKMAAHNKAYEPSAKKPGSEEPTSTGLFNIPKEPGTPRRMAGAKPVRTYPGGITTDRDKLRRIRRKFRSDED